MSVGEERLRLGARRRAIFANFCNHGRKGYPAEQSKRLIAEAMELSVAEVERSIRLVERKIANYRHRRCIRPAGAKKDPKTGQFIGGKVAPEYGMLPPIPGDTEEEIMQNAAEFLWTLQFVTDDNLSTEFLHVPTLTTHAARSLDDVREAAHAVRAGFGGAAA